MNTGTQYINAEWETPVFSFTMPHFAFRDKPEPILFYSWKEAEKFLKKLPKDWLVHLIKNK